RRGPRRLRDRYRLTHPVPPTPREDLADAQGERSRRSGLGRGTARRLTNLPSLRLLHSESGYRFDQVRDDGRVSAELYRIETDRYRVRSNAHSGEDLKDGPDRVERRHPLRTVPRIWSGDTTPSPHPRHPFTHPCHVRREARPVH